MPRLFVESLTTIDCALLDPRHGLVGNTFIADIELGGSLDKQAMVLDFREVKKRLKRAIDSAVDHRLLIPRQLAGVDLHESASRCELAFHSAAGNYEYRAPRAAVAAFDGKRITTALLTRHLQPLLAETLPPTITDIRLQLRPANRGAASYRYTHGLRRHDGHCRRLGHGHRSRVHIRVDGKAAPALAREWAAGWDGVHLGTRQDLLEHHSGQLRFGYDSEEGRYELAVPEPRCRLLDGASTVERLAEHIAQSLAATHPGHRIDVRAWEGSGKGGLASHSG